MRQPLLFDEPEEAESRDDDNWHDIENRSPEWWESRDRAMDITGVLDLRDDEYRFAVSPGRFGYGKYVLTRLALSPVRVDRRA